MSDAQIASLERNEAAWKEDADAQAKQEADWAFVECADRYLEEPTDERRVAMITAARNLIRMDIDDADVLAVFDRVTKAQAAVMVTRALIP